MGAIFQSTLHTQAHTGVMTHELTQPSEDMILARNAELRKNPGVIKDLGTDGQGGTWGRMVASIPEIMLAEAIREGFDLYSSDAKFASREMHRFLMSDKGKKCLVQGG